MSLLTNRWRSTLRWFQIGIVAVAFQLVAIITITAAATSISGEDFSKLVPSSTNRSTDIPILTFGMPFLTWAFLFTAIGFALTRSRRGDITAEHIRQAARAMRPTDPAIAIRILFAQCLLCAIGSAVISLSMPPDSLVVLARDAGYADLAPLVWCAAFSLGVAGFGAIAHAARRALA